MAGFLLSADRLQAGHLPSSLLCLLASFCVAGSVYTFNSIEGLSADRLNRRLADHALVAGWVTPSSMRALSVALGAAGLIAFAPLGLSSALLAGLVLLCGYLYSGRRFHGKERPGVSSLLHLVGAASFYGAGAGARFTTPVAVVGGVGLAILFMTGHLHHEIVDYEADREAGLRTLAVRYGVRRSLLVGTVGFALFYGVTLLAWYRGWWPASLSVPFLAGSVVHAVAVRRWFARASEGQGADGYRLFYRTLFLVMSAIAGLAYLATAR
jgi:4-hydroxybenzoate polyprenyltransferase